MATRVVTGQHRIAAVLEGAAEEGTADGGWSKLYRDRNGVSWKETRLGGEMHGCGISVVVRPPEPPDLPTDPPTDGVAPSSDDEGSGV